MFDAHWGDSDEPNAVATDPSPNPSGSAPDTGPSPNPSSSSAPDEPSTGASAVVGSSSSSSSTGMDPVGNPPVLGDDPETPAFSAYDVVGMDDALDGDDCESDLDGDTLDGDEDLTDPRGPSHPAPASSDAAPAVIQPSEREQKRKELEAKIAELRQGRGCGPNGLPKTHLTKIPLVASQSSWCLERSGTNFQVQKSKFHPYPGKQSNTLWPSNPSRANIHIPIL